MIPRTHFHCITTWSRVLLGNKWAIHLLILWFHVYYQDGAIIQYKYPNRVYFDCKTNLCLVVPCRQRKYIFTQESFYLHGIPKDINEQEASLLDCKHKHMMKCGAPPDKVGVLYCLLPVEFHSFTSRIDF